MTFNHYAKQGDLQPPLEDVLTDGAGVVMNLTGATVIFAMALDVDRVVLVGGAATVVGAATDGRVRYAWQVGDTDVPGVYLGEWHVDYGSGNVVRVPNAGYATVLVTARVGT